MNTINDLVPVAFVREQCCICGVPFFMPDYIRNQRLTDGALFHCPNGHGQQYAENINAKLIRATAQLQFERDQHAAAKAELEKLKLRVSCGTCPACRRNFTNLARHMKSKHPNFRHE